VNVYPVRFFSCKADCVTRHQAVFEMPRKSKKAKGDYRDSEFYLSYAQPGAETEKGYVSNRNRVCLGFSL
jgi:hypothetical protein